MRDFPIFTTEYGVSSLILKEIPYRNEAYIRIRDVQKDFFENHLAECEKCAGYYEAMQKTLPQMNEAEQKAQQAAFDSLAREMQRKKKKSTLKKVLLGIGIGVVALYLLLLGFSKVARIQVDVSPEEYDVRLSQLEDTSWPQTRIPVSLYEMAEQVRQQLLPLRLPLPCGYC